MTQGPRAHLASDGRLHLQHGPIDLVIRAWGAPDEVGQACRQATAAFDGLLEALVAELPVLRRPVAAMPPLLRGPVARRMVEATWPYRDRFVTPMAAVAGAVADHVLAAMTAGRRLDRAFVNNGGDMALHLGPGRSLSLGMVADIEEPRLDGRIDIAADDPVRGVATSGRGGRSFSLGIADAVSVVAATAAAADVAATLLGNAVDLDHPAIARRPARALDPDSDLGERLVTVGVGALDAPAIALALDRGTAEAQSFLAAGRIAGAVLWLRGHCRVVGPPHLTRVGAQSRATAPSGSPCENACRHAEP